MTQSTDPTANSPAGVIYSIPLDSARQDAQPHGQVLAGAVGGGGSSGGGASGGGTSGGGSGAAKSGSGRSAGSGSAQSSGASGRATGRSSTSVLVPGGQPNSLVHSANGFGSSAKIPGVNAAETRGLATVQGQTDSGPTFAILLAVVVLAIGGYVGTRARRALPPAPPSSS